MQEADSDAVASLEDPAEEGDLPAREVVRDSGLAETHLTGDLAHRARRVAGALEHLECCVEDLLATLSALAVFASGSGHAGTLADSPLKIGSIQHFP